MARAGDAGAMLAEEWRKYEKLLQEMASLEREFARVSDATSAHAKPRNLTRGALCQAKKGLSTPLNLYTHKYVDEYSGALCDFQYKLVDVNFLHSRPAKKQDRIHRIQYPHCYMNIHEHLYRQVPCITQKKYVAYIVGIIILFLPNKAIHVNSPS